MATSRTVRQVAGGERVWRELAFRDFGVCEPAGEETAPASTPEGDAREAFGRSRGTRSVARGVTLRPPRTGAAAVVGL